MTCECDWTYHQGQPCPSPPAEHTVGIATSPALCTPCLFVCCAERDDLEDPKGDDDA